MANGSDRNNDYELPNDVRTEWGVRLDMSSQFGAKFHLFKRTVSGYQTVTSWNHLPNNVVPEAILFDIVAAWTQRFTDDLVMSPGVQLVLPSET
jgi:hypothetical protein